MAQNNKVVIKFLADVDGMRKGINSVDKQLNGFSKGLKKFALTFGAAFSTKAIVDFAASAVNEFSKFEEASSKVSVVFQEQSSIIERWSEKAVTDIGLSSQAALEAAGTFGNLFTAFGVGVPEAREMSVTLTELSADLASFNDTSIDQALTALRSGLSGETEPLKRFGVALNQAAIEAKALELGLISNKNELDAAAKSQAVYALVLEQTTNAQGDFLRTQDGLANTQRTLNAALEEAKKLIGEGLYNAVTDLIQAFGGPGALADVIVETAERVGLYTEGMLLLLGVVKETELETMNYEQSLRKIADRYEANGKGIKGFLSIIGDVARETGTLPEVLAYVERRTKRVEEAMNNLENVKGPDHLSGELEKTARAVRALEIEAASADRALRKLYLNNPSDRILRDERQGDSFLRQFNDNDADWRAVKDVVKDIGFQFDDLGGSVGGASSALKDNNNEMEEAARILEDELQRALEETQRQIDEWRSTITSKMNLGTAFKEANDATARRDALGIDLAKLKADPNATADAIAALQKEFDEAGAEAGKNWLDNFAQQATDATALANNLKTLGASNLNEVLISQIASDSNGLALSQAIVDGITSGDTGLVAQLNRQANIIQDAGTSLGETLVGPLPEEGAKGGEDFLFGLKGAGKEGNGLLNQIKADAPKVKKAIKNSLRTSVEVKVIYTPDTSQLDGAPGGRSVVRSLQDFERLNGRKWRERVR